MKKFTFRPFRAEKSASPDDPNLPTQTPQQRRKEQVRRAQRTHRERQVAYTSSLEAEVVQLRANEARITQESKALQAEVNLLRRVLLQNGIPVPGQETRQEEKERDPGRGFTLVVGQDDRKRKNRGKQIYIQQSPEYVIPPTSQLISPPFSDSAASGYGSDTTSKLSETCLGALDPNVIGMDFVLTLESPCLPHIDIDTATTPESGHANTVSACLLHNHPSPPGQRLDSPVTWSVPSASIEQLLLLSKSVPLADGEVTPVQAWEYLRSHEQFASLEVTRWEALKEKLVSFVRCYGFGGVVDQVVFENAVFETFIVGRVF